MTQKISSSNIETATLASFSGPTIANVSIANSSYTILDDTAVSNAGGYVVITGTNFTTGAQVLFGSTSATSVTFVDSTQLNVQVPALTAGSYVVYVQNGDGSTAIKLNGITSSPIPVWSTGSTLTEQASGAPISISLSATSDSNVIYSVANGSSLPSGTTLAANGLFSGTVTIENDTTYNFSVNAIDTENQETLRAFSVNVIVSDALYYLTTLHLVDNGTNNANNNVFNDSSNNNFAITRNGNATQGTFSPFSQTGWSNYFDGTQGTCLKFGSNPNLALGSGNFTVEFWLYLNAAASGGFTTYFDYRTNGFNSANIPLLVDYNNNGKMTFAVGTGGGFTQILESSGTVPLNSWTHVALIRNGSTVTLYFNGTSVGSGSSSANFGTQTLNLNNPQTSGNYNGNYYISNFRIVNGTAVYTGNFTPPTAPLTAITNTALLTCQNNRFVDNSTNNLTLTLVGTPSVQAFSPFAPTAAYSAVTVGGSMYFDGTGDNLVLPTNSVNLQPGTGNYTIELFYYATAQAAAGENYRTIFSYNSGSGTGLRVFFQNSNGIDVWEGASLRLRVTNVSALNQWNHLAICRNGSTTRAFYNGTLIGDFSASTDLGGTLNIGNDGASGLPFFTGYISGFRVIKGTALYTSAFTPPAAPLTAISNTQFLANFTNAGITDATSKNVLETVGNAQVSTVQSKFGGSSILFDGTDDALIAPYSPLFNLGTGQFTIEAWVNFSALSGNRLIFDTYTAASTGGGYQLYWRGTGTSITFYGNGVVIAQSTFTSHVTGTWYHIAVTRDSVNSLRIFVDGTQYANTTYSTALNIASTAKIGVGIQVSTMTNDLSGYIDDLRVTVGQARYTSNFTPPASAFKTK
jgi:hypothetical protein